MSNDGIRGWARPSSSGASSVSLDIASLAADATPDVAADFVPTYDTSAAANKKATPANLSRDKLPLAGGTMTGDLIMSGSSKVRASGSTATTTGFQIVSGTDIGSLFCRAVSVATSGSGNGVASISASLSSGTLTITQTLSTFTEPTPGPP